VGVRVSAIDWVDGGLDVAQTSEFARRLKELGCSFMHVSTAGVSPLQKIALGPGYQVPFAQAIMTTDTFPKGAYATAMIDGQPNRKLPTMVAAPSTPPSAEMPCNAYMTWHQALDPSRSGAAPAGSPLCS